MPVHSLVVSPCWRCAVARLVVGEVESKGRVAELLERTERHEAETAELARHNEISASQRVPVRPHSDHPAPRPWRRVRCDPGGSDGRRP